ncbi:hypothetical protein GGI12_005123 [Dipsacomyces acuminosporus]|nr:hypothetical protein GGI12_005123 [Dipsacomyces acuminosporus]
MAATGHPWRLITSDSGVASYSLVAVKVIYGLLQFTRDIQHGACEVNFLFTTSKDNGLKQSVINLDSWIAAMKEATQAYNLSQVELVELLANDAKWKSTFADGQLLSFNVLKHI